MLGTQATLSAGKRDTALGTAQCARGPSALAALLAATFTLALLRDSVGATQALLLSLASRYASAQVRTTAAASVEASQQTACRLGNVSLQLFQDVSDAGSARVRLAGRQALSQVRYALMQQAANHAKDVSQATLGTLRAATGLALGQTNAKSGNALAQRALQTSKQLAKSCG